MAAELPAAGMARARQMAELSELLPASKPPARARRGLGRVRVTLPARLTRIRVSGLEGIPERYRLQILLMARDQLPGAHDPDVRGLADRIATEVKPPPRLVASVADDPRPLDQWFRGQAERITELAASLAAETAP